MRELTSRSDVPPNRTGAMTASRRVAMPGLLSTLASVLLLMACGGGGSGGAAGAADAGGDAGADVGGESSVETGGSSMGAENPFGDGGDGGDDDAGRDPRIDGDGEDGSAAGLRFVVAEDDVLVGTLSDPTTAVADTAEPYSLLSATARGTLELLPDGRSFRYRPEPDFNGQDGFEFASDDIRVLRATIDVTPVPDAPVLLLPDAPMVAEQDSPFALVVGASDADGDFLSFEASGLPSWLSFDGASGALSGTPSASDVGRVDGIRLAVVDPSGRRDERDGLSLEVIETVPTGSRPALDLTRLPAMLDGRERRVVELFDDSVDLQGQTLAIEGDPALVARVDGRRVILEATDVERVTDVILGVSLTDSLGRVSRADVPITLHPTSPSGRGHTLLGSRSGPGVHIVVLGDGYLAEQQALLREDAAELIAVIKADPGISSHIGAINFHVVESISENEGALPPGLPPRFHSTAFASRYDCEGVAQLICADVVEAFMQAGEEYDARQVVLFINDVRFGGSGSGSGIAIASRGAAEVALHELGHSLAGLADEYVNGALINALAPTFVEGLFPNVTAITDPERVPWARWLEEGTVVPSVPGTTGVGVYEGALYRERGVYRATNNSRMREFARPFGPVNSEQWVLSLYRDGSTVRDFDPRVFDVELAAGDSQRFSVEPFFPPDVQAIEWWLNGERVRRADDARVLEIAPPAGSHVLALRVRDVSGAIRLEPPHSGVFEWNWNVEVR